MNKKALSLAVAMSLFSVNIAFAGSNYTYKPAQVQPVYNSSQPSPQYAQDNTLKGSVVMVPAGTVVQAVLTTPVSSEYTTVGQTVNLALGSDFKYGDKFIAPAGSTISGTVIEASKAKHGSINGKLCIRFTQINTSYGTQIPINAVIKTEDGTGVLVGGTKMDVTKEYAKDVAVGSAAGALSGLVFGALAGGDKLGRGVALGTAVGAGGGLVKSAWDKGNDVEIPANSVIEIQLTQPVTASSSNYYYEN